jgi:hypothetical protein
MSDRLAWWLSFANSHAACVVETPADADVLDAFLMAHMRGCAGNGELRATFLAATTMERDVPRHLWYRLRTVADWRSCGVEVATDAAPPGSATCPLCDSGH